MRITIDAEHDLHQSGENIGTADDLNLTLRIAIDVIAETAGLDVDVVVAAVGSQDDWQTETCIGLDDDTAELRIWQAAHDVCTFEDGEWLYDHDAAVKAGNRLARRLAVTAA